MCSSDLTGPAAEAEQQAPLHGRERHEGAFTPEGSIGVEIESTEAEAGHGRSRKEEARRAGARPSVGASAVANVSP